MISRDYEFNVLGIYNFNHNGKLRGYYDWLSEHLKSIDGDIVEAGVFRGKSLLATGILLRNLGSEKRVYGFDSFNGFPPVYSKEDKLENFQKLYDENKITKDHLMQHKTLVAHRSFLKGEQINESNISSSEAFADTNLETVEKKISYLKLDNIKLVKGDFASTMTKNRDEPKAIAAALLDCDLHNSYTASLNFIWPRLSKGGIIFLDEYFSLKFPGARIATDNFFETHKNEVALKKISVEDTFERWVATKL
jgi:hypothetical protein